MRHTNDPADKLRVLNGFTAVHLDGASLTEVFYDEDGQPAWKPAQAATAG